MQQRYWTTVTFTIIQLWLGEFRLWCKRCKRSRKCRRWGEPIIASLRRGIKLNDGSNYIRMTCRWKYVLWEIKSTIKSAVLGQVQADRIQNILTVYHVYLSIFPFDIFFLPHAKGTPQQEMNTNSCSRVREKNEALLPVILQYLRNSEGKLETITKRNSLLRGWVNLFDWTLKLLKE